MIKIEALKNWQDGINQVICGDSLELMKMMPDKCIDLVLTDPPYGINADKGVGGFGSSKTDKHFNDNWDKKIPDKKFFDEILRIGKNIVIWGGQFMTEFLPPNGHWIVWDKKGDIAFDNPFGDCEIAWTNINKKSVKKYTIIQQGFISKEKQRYHPTQKPVELFMNILRDYGDNKIIFDPFMGSWTTARACKDLGRNFLGCELEEKYCLIGENRLKQQNLF